MKCRDKTISSYKVKCPYLLVETRYRAWFLAFQLLFFKYLKKDSLDLKLCQNKPQQKSRPSHYLIHRKSYIFFFQKVRNFTRFEHTTSSKTRIKIQTLLRDNVRQRSLWQYPLELRILIRRRNLLMRRCMMALATARSTMHFASNHANSHNLKWSREWELNSWTL